MASLSFTRNTDNPVHYYSGVMNYVNKSWGIVRYCEGYEILVAGGNWRLYAILTTAETSRGWTVYDTDPYHAGTVGEETNVNLTINPPSTALAGRYAFINPIGNGAPGVTRVDFYLDQDVTNLYACSVGALRGCMDMMATNYDPQAQIDDGSCVYPIRGCTNPLATNYNHLATIDDGSCILPVPPVRGCTNPRATNYNSAATVDDGSCILPPPVPGCTNPLATNYNSAATVDDGSCILPVRGCTNPLATNYNSAATVDDGSCIYPPPIRGCTNPLATNYNPLANVDDGSCILPSPPIHGCTNPRATNYNPSATIDDGSCVLPPPTVRGCTDPRATNYNPSATVNDGSCIYPPPISGLHGCTDPTATNYNSLATVDDGSCIYSPPTPVRGCTNPRATNYNLLATIDDGSCVFPQIVHGCTNPRATNYNHLATVDDGSCILPTPLVIRGCTNPRATNYNPAATVDDGSCVLPIVIIHGCTDSAAINYNPLATVDDGLCIYQHPTSQGCSDGPVVVPDIHSNTVSWFNNGQIYPAGIYSVGYVTGSMELEPNDGWSAVTYHIVNDAGHDVPIPYNGLRYATQGQCATANNGYGTSFNHSGGKIGVYLLDSPYSDNISGTPNPTYMLCPPPVAPPSSAPTDYGYTLTYENIPTPYDIESIPRIRTTMKRRSGGSLALPSRGKTLLLVGCALDGPNDTIISLQDLRQASTLYGPQLFNADYPAPVGSSALNGYWSGNTLIKSVGETKGISDVRLLRIGGVFAQGQDLVPGLHLKALYAGASYNGASVTLTSDLGATVFAVVPPRTKGRPYTLRIPSGRTLEQLCNLFNADPRNQAFILSVDGSASRMTAQTISPQVSTSILSGGSYGTEYDLYPTPADLYAAIRETDTWEILQGSSEDMIYVAGIYADDDIGSPNHSFVLDLGQLCMDKSLEGLPTLATIGLRPLSNPNLRSVSNRVNSLSTPSFTYDPSNKVNIAQFLTNGLTNSSGEDLGRFVSICAGPDLIFTGNDLSAYVESPACWYASFACSTISPNTTTNKRLPSDLQTNWKFTHKQLNLLNGGVGFGGENAININATEGGGAYVALKQQPFGRGWCVVEDVTAAPRNSAFAHLYVSRILKSAEEVVQNVTYPYIGQTNASVVITAMDRQLTQALDKFASTGALQGNRDLGYGYRLWSTVEGQLLGILYLTLWILPVGEIHRIDSIITVTG